MSPLRYAFGRLLMWRLDRAVSRDPVLDALSGMTISVGLNVMTLAVVLTNLQRWSVIWFDSLSGKLVSIIVVIGVVGGGQYMLWVADDLWKEIVEALRASPPIPDKVGAMLVILYLVLSLLALPVLGLVFQ